MRRRSTRSPRRPTSRARRSSRYFPTKEEIVFGEGAAAIDGLAVRLRERSADETTIDVVRAWLGELAGWLEPELVLQQRLVREVPVVGARQLQLYGAAERAIADSLEAELGAEQRLAARLAASALVAGLRVVEETAAARMEHEDRALTAPELEALLDGAVVFAEAGIRRLRSSKPGPCCARRRRTTRSPARGRRS